MTTRTRDRSLFCNFVSSADFFPLIKAFFSVSPLSERFGFCHSQTQLSAIIMHLRIVSPQCIIIIRGQFVGVNKPSRLNAYRYHFAEGLALQCFSSTMRDYCIYGLEFGVDIKWDSLFIGNLRGS